MDPIRLVAPLVSRLRLPSSRVLCTTSSADLIQRIELSPGVVEVRLCAPRGNTFNLEMIELFTQTIHELESDVATQGVVLTSGVPHVFCAGLDLTIFLRPEPDALRHYWASFETMWKAWYTTPLCTAAAIGGACPALGAVLALSADYRVMREDARSTIGLNETELAMVPPIWLQAVLGRTLGERESERHLQCATKLAPRDAKAVGFVDATVPEATSDATLVEAGAEALLPFLKIPFAARAQTKMNQRVATASLANPESVEVMAKCILGNDFQNTVAAILKGLKERSAAKKAKAAAAAAAAEAVSK